MPRVTIYRKIATNDALQIGVGTLNAPNALTLFPGQNRASAVVAPAEVAELLEIIKGMEEAGTIGWGYNQGDIDADDVKILGGLDVSDGTSANTITDYYMNISPGTVKFGAHIGSYQGFEDTPVLASGATLVNDLDDPTTGNTALEDGNAIKIRWYVLREYFPGSNTEVIRIYGVAGDEGLIADVGVVGDFTTGYVSDDRVDKIFDARDEIVGASRRVIEKFEFARALFTRSGATVTGSFYELKKDNARQEGLMFVDQEVDFSDISTASLSNTVNFNRINGIFAGCSLQTLEASDLAALTIELGTTGEVDELFDGFDVGTGGSNGLGLQATVPRGATPKIPNSALISYRPLLTFTGGANLDTATAGKWRVRIWYFAEPENTQQNEVREDNFNEGQL